MCSPHVYPNNNHYISRGYESCIFYIICVIKPSASDTTRQDRLGYEGIGLRHVGRRVEAGGGMYQVKGA